MHIRYPGVLFPAVPPLSPRCMNPEKLPQTGTQQIVS